MLNLHHLELFYHVARSGGITAATRSIPYGIQQPAISAQIQQLEADLGTRLFQRRPFQLTPAGESLFQFVSPFFSKLPEIASQIAGQAHRRLRLAAPATVLRQHLPDLLDRLRSHHPKLELSLYDTDQRGAIDLLDREEVDLAICDLDAKAPSGYQAETLIHAHLGLLLPPGFTDPSPTLDTLAQSLPLIRPSRQTMASRIFHRHLQRQRLLWDASIEVDSLDMVHAYVSRGFGAGLTIIAPGITFPPETTLFPIAKADPLEIVALWRGRIHPLGETFLKELKNRARTLRQSAH